MTLLRVPAIRALCWSGCGLCLAATGFDVVFVLFCFSGVKSGGLGFDVRRPRSTIPLSL
jgi:hypothetical protein